MLIERALNIAEREWANIRTSLEKCGDTGEFISKYQTRGRSDLQVVSNSLFLVRNLIEMDNKLPAYGYHTTEAGYVFTELATKAGKRLGLKYRFAKLFGSGYSWIRTGRFYTIGLEREHLVNQLFFITIFLPLGSFLKCDYNSPVLQTKLKTILCKFITWQDNPDAYHQYVIDYNPQQESNWSDLLLVMDFPLNYDCEENRLEEISIWA